MKNENECFARPLITPAAIVEKNADPDQGDQKHCDARIRGDYGQRDAHIAEERANGLQRTRQPLLRGAVAIARDSRGLKMRALGEGDVHTRIGKLVVKAAQFAFQRPCAS